MSERAGRLLTVLVIAFGTMQVTGCGTAPSNDDQVKSVVRTFLESLGHDGGKACAVLTEEARYSLVTFAHRTPCARAAASIKSAGPALRYFEDNFEGIRYRGTRDQVAEVDIKPATDFTPLQPIPLVKVRGQWRISDIDWYYE